MVEAKMPRCCGKEMRLESKLGPFSIAVCDVCGENIYIKDGETQKPQLIED